MTKAVKEVELNRKAYQRDIRIKYGIGTQDENFGPSDHEEDFE